MTTIARGRTRPRLVKLAAGFALAGTALGLIETGAVHAAVSPPLNLTATQAGTPSNPSININWDTPTTGDPVTYYRVRIDNVATALNPDFTTFTPATQTEYNGYAAVPGATYNIAVASNDEPTLGTAVTSITITPAPIAECSTVATEWNPFCTVDAFINQQYRDWADRLPTLDERNFWRAYLQPRNQAPNGTQNVFLENMRQSYDVKAGPVVRLYIAYFLRNPEYAGYKYWLNAISNGGWTMGQVSDFFARSPEFQARYGNLDNGAFVSLVYNNVFGRNPDAAGYAFWVRQLESGQSRGWMMMQMTEAPSFEFQQRTRIAVAATEIYAEMLNRVPTLAEYDAATYLLAGTSYPLNPGEVNPLYLQILNSAEYRARIVIR